MRSLMRNPGRAVSPVVGVMLMLAITIMIAAIVSAFAGNAASTTAKTPQATIQATYSISGGMTIAHRGGDPVPVGTTTLYVRPTKSFGAMADKYAWHIDKDIVMANESVSWNSSRAFLPGDTVTISSANLDRVQMREDGTTEESHSGTSLDFMASASRGFSFVIELQDSSGKAIGRSTVIISA